MRTIAKLIKKKKLKKDYKLTFANQRGNLYLILHRTQQAIFTNLRVGINYSFFYFCGKKSYFIKPQSIKETRKNSFSPVRSINTKNILLNKLHRDLHLKTNENVSNLADKITKNSNLSEIIRTIKVIMLNERTYGKLTQSEQQFLSELNKLSYLNNYV